MGRQVYRTFYWVLQVIGFRARVNYLKRFLKWILLSFILKLFKFFQRANSIKLKFKVKVLNFTSLFWSFYWKIFMLPFYHSTIKNQCFWMPKSLEQPCSSVSKKLFRSCVITNNSVWYFNAKSFHPIDKMLFFGYGKCKMWTFIFKVIDIQKLSTFDTFILKVNPVAIILFSLKLTWTIKNFQSLWILFALHHLCQC